MELFELPGRIDKFCLECSADLATAILLSSEIDAATLAGRNTNALVSEFAEISGRMLDRAQSAEFGFRLLCLTTAIACARVSFMSVHV